MSTTNLTGTLVNGVYEISVANSPTTAAGATSEQILFISSGDVQASGTATVTFTSCNIYLDNVSSTAGNPNAVALSYNGDSTDRGDNGRYIRFIDSQIIYYASARRNIFVSELTRSNVIDQDSGSQLFVYTQPNATLDTVLIQGINTMEVVGQFTTAFNLTIDDVTKSYLNWEAGRLDFFGLAILNKPVGDSQADIWIGNGASNNHSWHWNNDSTFNNERLYLTATNNRYYDGNTISWKFIDRDTGSSVPNVLVIYNDNFVNVSMTERARFDTTSGGILNGTFDSQNRTTGSDIDRPTLFVVTNAVETIDTGSPGSYAFPTSLITGDQGNRTSNYNLDVVDSQIEIRSYLYERPTGFKVGVTFSITEQIGEIASDLSILRYQDFILAPDVGISVATISTVDAYTSLETLDKLYDRIKAEWFNTDDYPIALANGNTFDLGLTKLIVDGGTTSVYDYNSGNNEITISPASAASITRVGQTEVVSSGEDDEIIIAFPSGIEDNDVAYIAVGHSQADENVWNTPSGWVIPTGLTEVQTGGSPASIPGVSIFRRVLSGDSGSVTITNAGTNISGIVAQMIVYRNVDTTNPEDVTSTTATGATGDPDPASITTTSDDCMILTFGFMDDGDQTTPTSPSGYTTILDTSTLDGAGTGE